VTVAKNFQSKKLERGQNNIRLVREVKKMSRSRVNIPGSQAALENMKFEIANQMNVNLKQGYNGNLTSRENGTVGGYMVKKMITDYQNQASGK
jgi:hypothetical protein